MRTHHLVDDELKEAIQKQSERRKNTQRLNSFVFVNRAGSDKIKRFDKAWKRACLDAEIGVRLSHMPP